MMNEPVRQALTQKIEEAKGALEASLVGGDSIPAIRSHERSLQMLDRLLCRFAATKRPGWLLPLVIASVAVSLVGLAAVVHLPRPLVTVDARISSLLITAAAEGMGLTSNATVAAKSFKSLQVAGDAEAQVIASQAIAISSLKLLPGTTAVVHRRPSCVEFDIFLNQTPAKAGMATGLDVVVLHPAKGSTEMPPPVPLRAMPGTTVTICGDLPANYALAGSVDKVDLYLPQPGDAMRGFVKLRTPSIVSGKFRLPNVNRTSDLQDTDMLALGGVTNGWIFLFPTASMRVVFSGTVERPTSISPTSEGGTESLEPTVLEWFTKSPLVTALSGLVTGLVGMIWAIGKYFGFLAR